MVISDIILSENHAPISIDFHFPSKGDNPVPVIIFLHGFKGFKDWGHFPLVADYLTRSGFAVVRFNFSLNGTTPEHQKDFVDLDAFARNTYSQELEDVSIVIDNIFWRAGKEMNCDPRRLGLLGHSRGGGIAILAAQADKRVKAVATWAGVCEFESRVNPENLEEWKKNGVVFSHNSRTNQKMPLNISLRNDFYTNKKKLDIPFAVQHMNIPQLIVHGTNDTSVSITEAEKMKEWNLLAQLVEIENANHTFGGKHPWTEKDLPNETIKALQATIGFFRENL